MAKNGLFLCSIGFLIFLYSLNPNSMRYDLLSMATGIFLVLGGGALFFKAHKKEESKKPSE
jgi:Protein of unknown function (DUF3188).